jgi:hypothetical protein
MVAGSWFLTKRVRYRNSSFGARSFRHPTADIVIGADEVTTNQIVFVFQLDCDSSDPFSSAILEVKIPGDAPRQLQVPLPTFNQIEGRSRWTLRWPFLLQMARLRPGRIQTRVLHDKGEIDAGGIWIVTAVPTPGSPGFFTPAE